MIWRLPLDLHIPTILFYFLIFPFSPIQINFIPLPFFSIHLYSILFHSILFEYILLHSFYSIHFILLFSLIIFSQRAWLYLFFLFYSACISSFLFSSIKPYHKESKTIPMTRLIRLTQVFLWSAPKNQILTIWWP